MKWFRRNIGAPPGPTVAVGPTVARILDLEVQLAAARAALDDHRDEVIEAKRYANQAFRDGYRDGQASRDFTVTHLTRQIERLNADPAWTPAVVDLRDQLAGALGGPTIDSIREIRDGTGLRVVRDDGVTLDVVISEVGQRPAGEPRFT